MISAHEARPARQHATGGLPARDGQPVLFASKHGCGVNDLGWPRSYRHSPRKEYYFRGVTLIDWFYAGTVQIPFTTSAAIAVSRSLPSAGHISI